jgi:hypothetical protein
MFSIRLPKVVGELVLFEPRAEGPHELGHVRFDPATGRRGSALGGEANLGEPVRIAGNADSADALDIFILPEGYTESEMPQFEGAVTTIAVTGPKCSDRRQSHDRPSTARGSCSSRRRPQNNPEMVLLS